MNHSFPTRPAITKIVQLLVPCLLLATGFLSGCKSRSAEKVLKAAPKGTTSVIHAEAGAAGELIGRIENEMKTKGVEEQEFSHILSAIQAIAGKSSSADLYLVVGKNRRQPLPLLIVYTASNAEEFSDMIIQIAPPSAKMSKAVEGKFVLIKENNRPEMAVADSRAFPQIGTGVALGVPDTAQLEAMISTLNSGASQELTALTEKIDAGADVWGVMTWPESPGPKSIVGSLYLSGKKISSANLVFRDADDAKDFEKEMNSEKSPLPKGSIQVNRTDAEVAVSGTLNDTFVTNLVEAIGGARLQAMRVRSANNLHQIGMAVRMHMADKNAVPENLIVLVKDKYLSSANILVSPASGRTMRVDDKGMPLEQSDYIYFALDPNKMTDYSLIQAYEPAELNKGKGGNVLHLDGAVEWMDARTLEAAVKKTRDAMKK